MKKLSSNWITENPIDFEHKKYILLAYLQEINKNFNKHKLYPFFTDLIFHYKNLTVIKKKKGKALKNFPKKISKLNLEKLILEYELLIKDSGQLEEIDAILNFAIPVIDTQMQTGKELYEFVEDKLEIFPVGVVPLNTNSGYMFIRAGKLRETVVYEYVVTIFENADEKYRGIHTKYIATYKKSYANTFEQIKIDLLRKCKIVTHPATYAIESKFPFPFNETLLPIAKRSLMKITSERCA